MLSSNLKIYALDLWDKSLIENKNSLNRVTDIFSSFDINDFKHEPLIDNFCLLRNEAILLLIDFDKLLTEQSRTIIKFRVYSLSWEDTWSLFYLYSRQNNLKAKMLRNVAQMKNLSEKVELEKTQSAKKVIKIKRAPGYRLFNFACVFYSNKSVNECFVPLLIEWAKEYHDELRSENMLKARMVSLRNYYAFIKLMIELSPIGDLFEVIRKLFGKD